MLPNTIEAIDKWDRSGYKIILTTGRKESFRKVTEDHLRNLGIIYDQLIIELKPTPALSETDEPIIAYAKTYIGIPYVYGGNNRKGFDCSGFTKDVYINYNHSLPRTAQDQSNFCEKVKLKNIKSGDLLFFGKSSSKISHVGIAIKNNGEELKMIHASSSKGIIISTVTTNSYWSEKFQFAGRVTH